MPGAHVHDAITVVTGLALAPISYSALVGIGLPIDAAIRNTAILVGAHMLSGIMFSPDLDLDSAIDDRWGIFFWIWRPYMWLVPHRSRLFSHGLVIAPLLRLLYFYLMVVLLLITTAWLLARVGIALPDLHIRLSDALLGVMRNHPQETQSFLAGFITGSAAHTLADWLVTGGKRYLRRLGFRVTIDYSGHDGWRPRYRRARSS
ncbi:MAG TPA: metal-binding protein [Roseiflexaceae bacterium]|nr:metal-binding protein [Roseiflexaceae bacterium]